MISVPRTCGVLVFTIAAACANRQEGPHVASSADSAAYAETYPDDLSALTTRHRVQAESAQQISDKLPEYPAQLSEPDWTLVESLYEQAVDEGRSGAYVQHQREEIVLARFHEQERKPLVRRIVASNEYVVKEKGCDANLWGATDRGLEKGLEERLEARRRGDSDAHRLIEEEEERLGKKNQEPLRDQVDQIRFASYVIHVGLPSEENELRRRLDEASTVKSTLEDHLEKAKSREQPDAEQVDRIQLALSNIDPTVEKARKQLEQAEQKRKELQQRFESSFDQLMQTVETAKNEQEAKAASSEGAK